MLLRTHRLDADGDSSWPEERRRIYKAEADKFLQVTRRLADLEWTREDHKFRNCEALTKGSSGLI